MDDVGPLSNYDYSWATDSPDASVPRDRQRPLPALWEPDVQPPAPEPGGEALVEVSHRKVRVLPAYWHAGWPSATPTMWLRRGAAERLYAVAESLGDRWGLAVLDAWRPLELQQELFDAAYGDPGLPPGFVSEPSRDPATPPPHLTGGAVDVTLTWAGRPLALGTAFDDFSDTAWTGALEHEEGPEREGRRRLFWAMRDQGFVVADCEWWHFEWGTRRWSALVGDDVRYGATEPPR